MRLSATSHRLPHRCPLCRPIQLLHDAGTQPNNTQTDLHLPERCVLSIDSDEQEDEGGDMEGSLLEIQEYL